MEAVGEDADDCSILQPYLPTSLILIFLAGCGTFGDGPD